MANYRLLNTAIWDDAWFSPLNVWEKLAWVYLLTNPLCNVAGVYEITMRRMEYDLRYPEGDIQRILDTFHEAGKAHHWNDLWMVIPNYPKHQQTKNGNIVKGIENILATLPMKLVAALPELGYSFPTEGTRRDSKGLQGTPRAFKGLQDRIQSNINKDNLTGPALSAILSGIRTTMEGEA